MPALDSLDCDLPDDYRKKTVKEVVDYAIQSATAKEQKLAEVIRTFVNEFSRMDADPIVINTLVCDVNGKAASLDDIISKYILVNVDILIGDEQYTVDLADINFYRSVFI